jgi:glyoxylase-like metal-dependent hydrolase (beta-lactamase superfamily II)
MRQVNMVQNMWPDVLPRAGNQRLERLESVSPWFEIYKVSAGVFALLEPSHTEEAISYLILGSEHAVLLDTGMGIANLQTEVARLTDLPIVVVASHGHYDHIGDNHRFDKVWAFDSDSDVARIEQGKTREACAHYLESGNYLELPDGFDPAAYEILPSRVTRRLQHLEVIDLGGRTLTVHHTPGHTQGSICLLDSRDNLLFTGDTFYPGMLFAHFEDSDFAAYQKSIEYLIGLLPQVNHLCPSHNEVHVDKAALARVKEAFEQIVTDEALFETEGNARVYRFDGFGLMMPA